MSYMSGDFCEGCDRLRKTDDGSLRDRVAEVREWAQARIRYCETVLVKYAVPLRPDIPLEPVERRGELRALRAVLSMLDGMLDGEASKEDR